MALKLIVGINKKVGLPAYSSLGASCHVEVELDQSLVFYDLEAFRDRVRHVYAACRQAVRDELAHQQTVSEERVESDRTISNGHTPSRASQRQLDYMSQLAGQICDLGSRRLE